jgi:hypothetical protein
MEEKLAWIEEVYEKEGIRLELDKIVKNSARRAVSKLLLNSLWG